MNLQNGFLLSFIKYGENDAVLHCFTEEEGFQSYFLKGIYSKKNKKKALLQPLNQLSFSVYPSRGNSISSVSRFELVKNNDIYTDVKINTIIFFISDFLSHVLKYENKNTPIYSSIEDFIHQLTHKNYQAHLLFLLDVLKIQGVAPLMGEGSFLDPETGTFSLQISHQLFNEEISTLWKEALYADDFYATKVRSSLRKDFLDSILIYYHYHITDFKTPASLEIIQQIFE
ncbi:DNA repair protein RecO [Chryseobacterium sp.]|uniref:DNA repair protein RecO n=1 Tax=Chryseobacterium sp. TaxID=1871047 RepID=UPI001AFFBFF9|nr:DNA repair protein RecO [Chryseobacterium sp.]MBO9693843.1 DNA repair protein RecO [Chryseobacterium sp.]